MKEEELLAKITELEGRIASLEMRDDYTPAAESPVMEVPAPESLKTESDEGWRVRCDETNIYVKKGETVGLSCSVSSVFSAVGVNWHFVRKPDDPTTSWWICVACYTVSGRFECRLAYTETPPAWNNADLFSGADPGVQSSYSFAEFKTVCRQWRIVAHSEGSGFVQDHVGSIHFDTLHSDIMAAENGFPGTGRQKSGFIERVGDRLRLCFDYDSGTGTPTYLLGIKTDGNGIWHLVRVTPPAGTETITYIGSDGRQHTVTVLKQ